MSCAEQTNQIAGAVHDESKEVGNVPTEYAHVQGFQFREGGQLAAKDNSASVVTAKCDGRAHANRRGSSTHTGQLSW
jgi:hypothetical protein